MVRLFYNLVWPLGLLIFLPGYLVKMFRRGGYREKFGQRLAFYDADVAQRLRQGRPRTWIHAVSVGEVGIALKLLDRLRRLEPDIDCVLTTTTTTGFALATKRAPAWVEVMYMPVDFWPIMRRGFAAIRPKRVVLVEGEVWPNLMAIACRRNVPVALVNARLSPRSWSRFKRFRFFVRPLFGRLSFIAVPERDDVQRWRLLRGSEDQIFHTGSVKYDPEGLSTEVGTARSVNIFDAGSLVLFGGSTHKGEEQVLARIFRALKPTVPLLRLFLAPRHAERAGDVERELSALGVTSQRLSELSSNGRPGADCVILDRTGELAEWYRIATLVFVGKSLLAHGGQNPVEAIMAGVPVTFGPHMENFANLSRALVEQNGAVQVADEAQLEKTIAGLLRDAGARAGLVVQANGVVAEHRGATPRTAELIVRLL